MTSQQVISLVVSLILLVILVAALVKKISPALALMVCGILGLIYFTVSTGASVIQMQGFKSSGNYFIDIFAYIEKVCANLLSSNILTLMAIMGCVYYFNHLKATTLLCLILAEPLKRIKWPFLVVAMVAFVTMLLKFSILSVISQMALVIATLYPIMIMLGISKATAASIMLFAGYINWGPANFFFLIFSKMGDTQIPVTEYFMRFEFPATIVTMLICLIVFYFISKYFDRKEGAVSENKILAQYTSPKDLKLPYYYAIFPLLPVILVIIFSGKLFPITLSVTTACIISWLLAFFIDLIRRKDRFQAMEDTLEFWKGCGAMIVATGSMIIAATVFAGAIEYLGGFSSAFTSIMAGGGSIRTVAIVGSLAAGLFLLLTGSVNGCMLLFGPLMAQVADAAGGGFLQIIITLIPVGQITGCLALAAPAVIYVAGQTEVPLFTLIKRNTVPVIVYCIIQIIMTQFILWPLFSGA